MGEVEILQYYHGVLDMPMPEVFPHGSPCRLPATKPLNWAVPRPCLCRKRHPVSPGIVAPALYVALLSRTPLSHVVMGLEVHRQ